MSADLAAVDGGTMTIGQYRLHQVIGRGGSSVVYRASNEHSSALPPVVAVKVAHNDQLPDGDFREQFQWQFEQQWRVSAAVDHPGVLPVFESGDDRGRPYLVMPHVVGADLAHRLSWQTLPISALLALLAQVADGLDAMHRAGILHLDVKPANVLVGRVLSVRPAPAPRQAPAPRSAAPVRSAPVRPVPAVRPAPAVAGSAAVPWVAAGTASDTASDTAGSAAGAPVAGVSAERAYLTDLGLCRFLADEAGSVGGGSGERNFVGSPRYASPEHLRGRPVRPSSDVYSLACVLFSCLAGHPPYVGDVPAVVTGHLSGRVPSLSALTALPRRLDRVIRRGMHPDPGSRFGSCAELVAGVRRAIFDVRA